ncbi:hypothetical protein [Pantoea vagans]|uniref:hypothetical protein n=1 Tax=Pantoea vagans TaxID=470934 RepID=UPI00223C25E6|nr:hypothetical protein [Pantoea vagans]
MLSINLQLLAYRAPCNYVTFIDCVRMEKIYGATNFVMDSGERYCMVVDRSYGLPEYFPNLFLTTQIRNRGDAFSM